MSTVHNPSKVEAIIFDCFGVLYIHEKNFELLQYISELKTNCKIGLLSNITREGLERRFSSQELTDLFDGVSTSGDTGLSKPDAEAYLGAAEKLGVSPEACVMIDDREDCCYGAISVGMQAIEYRTVAQLRQKLDPMIKK